MSTSRATLAAAFGTLTTAANTVTSTFDAINDGIGMLNSTVKDARSKQSQRQLASQASFTDQLIRDMSRQEAEADLKELEFINKSADHKAAYEKHFERYSVLLKPTVAK